MRIGRFMLDTDNMTVEEMNTLINELRAIRARKIKKETFTKAMLELLADAKSEGFTFMDKDFGQIIEAKDLVIYDKQG